MSVEKDKKNHQTSKGVGELLSVKLTDLKEKFKGTPDDVNQVILSADESFEKYKEDYEESLKIVDPKITPLSSTVITTAMLLNMMDVGHLLIGQEFNVNLVNQFKQTVSEKQVVVAVGAHCKQVEIGDIVTIRLSDFTRIKNPNTVNSQEEIAVPIEDINGRKYLVIHESNIKYKDN